MKILVRALGGVVFIFGMAFALIALVKAPDAKSAEILGSWPPWAFGGLVALIGLLVLFAPEALAFLKTWRGQKTSLPDSAPVPQSQPEKPAEMTPQVDQGPVSAPSSITGAGTPPEVKP